MFVYIYVYIYMDRYAYTDTHIYEYILIYIYTYIVQIGIEMGAGTNNHTFIGVDYPIGKLVYNAWKYLYSAILEFESREGDRGGLGEDKQVFLIISMFTFFMSYWLVCIILVENRFCDTTRCNLFEYFLDYVMLNSGNAKAI
jgi:hypothetical protein